MIMFAYLKEILLGIVGFLALYLFNRNNTLKVKKQILEQDITNKNKVINVQNRVMEATTNVTHSDINSSIDRLSKLKSKK